MAKGNLFLGGARGSVGDVTLSVNKGQQVTRRRNRQPNNPRTFAQMKQRARFAYLSKFFSKATQQFFKMAFEDRRSNESDYNAFMRHNLKNVPYATKVMVDNPNTPWFGHFLMTKGSLSSLDSLISIHLNGNLDMVYTYPTEAITVGMLSASILEDTTLLPNDIITIAHIKGAQTSTPVETLEEAISNEALSFDNGIAPAWTFIQFRLNTSDTTPITDLGFGTALVGEQYHPYIKGNDSSVSGGVIVASRNTKGGLKVSDSHIITNGDLDNAIAVGLSPEWADFCASNWQATEEAILQGALLAPGREPEPEPTNIVSSTNPVLPSSSTEISIGLTKAVGTEAKPEVGAKVGTINGMDLTVSSVGSGISLVVADTQLAIDLVRESTSAALRNVNAVEVKSLVIYDMFD